jgi:pyruvate kinase
VAALAIIKTSTTGDEKKSGFGGLIGDRAGIMAKIEKPAALEHIDDIIRLSDAIMVAPFRTEAGHPPAKAVQKV